MTQLASQQQGGTGKSVTVAGIDCGTNSIRLKISRVDANGYEDIVPRVLRVVRLGQDVDKTHRFADEALERVYAAAREFAQILADLRKRSQEAVSVTYSMRSALSATGIPRFGWIPL